MAELKGSRRKCERDGERVRVKEAIAALRGGGRVGTHGKSGG